MAFNLVLVSHTPPTASEDPDAVAAALLRDVGLLPGGLEVPEASRRRRRGRPRRGTVQLDASADPPRPGEEVLTSVPYRMLMDCFWSHPDRGFTVEELGERLGASRPTVYRHLLKLRGLDIVSTGEEGIGGAARRSYCLRYGSPSRAWRFVEVNAECAMAALRDRVDLVWREARERRKRGERTNPSLGKSLRGPGICFDFCLSDFTCPMDGELDKNWAKNLDDKGGCRDYTQDQVPQQCAFLTQGGETLLRSQGQTDSHSSLR